MSKEIIVIGLGPGSPDALSLGALRALKRGRDGKFPLFARTLLHPIVEWLESSEGIEFDASFDATYESRTTFAEVYADIAESLMHEAEFAGTVGYAVPGHPSFGERTVELLQELAPSRGIELTIIASASYLDAVLIGESAVDGEMRILDALEIIRLPGHFAPEPQLFSPAALHVIMQVYDRVIASELKLALLEVFPPETLVKIVTAAGIEGMEQRTARPLSEMDHGGVDFNHLTTVLIPPMEHPENFAGYQGLLTIMARLRDPETGCPWDREQTPEKLRRYMIEEAYEVLEAIDSGDPDKYAEELGDLMLQVVFHAQLARENGRFTMRDIVHAITSKLVRRHPHVFGNVEVSGAEQVLTNWNAIKRSEKGYEDRKSLLDGVPMSMPALMRAQEISRRAAKAGFEWDAIDGVFDKLDEEVAELKAAINTGDDLSVADELGDLLFTVVNLARFQKTEAEDALSRMLTKFTRRFHKIEAFATEQGKSVKELSLAEMERVWQLAKRE